MRTGFMRAGGPASFVDGRKTGGSPRPGNNRVRVAGLAALFGIAATACARNEPPPAPPRPAARSSSVDPKTGTSASPRLYGANTSIPKGGGSYKVGVPYQVSGRWYYPKHDPSYDRTGVASWYGDDFHGRKTANGEIYDMMAMSAAHTTLPMPSYAWVTNLENGRTVLVRVNDRGPYAHDRVIDLSRAAARALGSELRGLSQVRVRYAGPAPLNGDDRREQAYLRSQPWYGNVAQSPQRPPSRLSYMRPYAEAVVTNSHPSWRPTMALGAPRPSPSKIEGSAPVPENVPAQAPSRLLIAGVFRSEANARARIADLGPFAALQMVPLTTAIGTVYQVRSGPMESDAALLLLHEMTVAGIKDIMLAGTGQRGAVR